ncbi:MAG: hypothetical protein E7K72_17940, partial [Roseomonas mucosa]|nr:hypothetical protein [Roseomonas mucosa]
AAVDGFRRVMQGLMAPATRGLVERVATGMAEPPGAGGMRGGGPGLPGGAARPPVGAAGRAPGATAAPAGALPGEHPGTRR